MYVFAIEKILFFLIFACLWSFLLNQRLTLYILIYIYIEVALIINCSLKSIWIIIEKSSYIDSLLYSRTFLYLKPEFRDRSWLFMNSGSKKNLMKINSTKLKLEILYPDRLKKYFICIVQFCKSIPIHFKHNVLFHFLIKW